MRFKINILLVALLSISIPSIVAQEKFDAKDKDSKSDDKKATSKTAPPQTSAKSAKVDFKKGLTTGFQVAESTILIYSNLRGRLGLNQIRKTTVEVGKLEVTNGDGTIVKSSYEQRVLRAKDLKKERVRINRKLPDAEYSMVYDGKKVFGLYNNSVFTPRDDALSAFRNRIWHGLEALLRYNENGSKVKLEKRETVMGVDFYVISVTDKEKRVTTFYVSKKSFRVMMLKYEVGGIKFRRKFYDHNYAQGTLVPYRTVLWANEKIVEEKKISTVTYGQPIGEEIFAATEL